MKLPAVSLVVLLAMPASAIGQASPPNATIEGVMTELYASVSREPGHPFPWGRMRAVMHPSAVMLPQPAQTGGRDSVMTIDDFIAWIDAWTVPLIGTERDQGFFERQTNLVIHQYGDVAIAFSTYEKGPWEPRRVMGRGINAMQLVRRDGRWYVLSIAWDEENIAGALPPEYRGN